jgi:hypothetical protein
MKNVRNVNIATATSTSIVFFQRHNYHLVLLINAKVTKNVGQRPVNVPIGNRQNVVVHMVVLRTPFGEDTIALAHQQDVPEPLNVNMIPLAVNVQ